MSIAGIFPTVTGDFVSAANSAGCEHDCFRSENFEAAAFAFVAKGANGAIAIFQDRQDRVFHMHVDAAVHAMILQGANHLQTGTVADMGEPWIFVAAESELQRAPELGALENCPP